MKEKFKCGIKAGAVVIIFLISDMLFTKIYTFFLMNLNVEEHLLRLYVPIERHLLLCYWLFRFLFWG